MEITQWYAMAITCIAVCCLTLRILSQIANIGDWISQLLAKQFLYRYIIGRHTLIGPWSLAFVLAQMAFLGMGDRGGALALINLSSLVIWFQFDRIAHALGIPLDLSREIHRSMGLNAFVLAAIHVVVAAAKDTSILSSLPQHPFLITAIVSTCLLAVLSWRIIRMRSYELFLWFHRALGILCLYSIWQHIPPEKTSYYVYLYAAGTILMATLVINVAIILIRNGLLSQGRCFAVVHSTCGMIKIRLHLSRPVRVEPGQYVNLWLPSASFWAFTQAHPFMVTSWEEAPQKTLDLFIQPRRGFTRNVASLSSLVSQPTSWRAMFGGPYGQIIETYRFEKVLMVANGAGIAGQIPFLRKLIHGYHARQAFTRRIHLVWHIHDTDIGIAAEPMLNEALDEDKLASGGILHITIFVDNVEFSGLVFGRRSVVCHGTPDYDDILMNELEISETSQPSSEMAANSNYVAQSASQISPGSTSYQYSMERTLTMDQLVRTDAYEDRNKNHGRLHALRKRQRLVSPSCNEPEPGVSKQGNREKLLVLVSGFSSTRDRLRLLCCRHLNAGSRLVETEFQPFDG